MIRKNEQLELMRTIVSLDMGIIPINMDLREAFSKMSEEDARKAKRKFRKLKRRVKKSSYGKEASKGMIESFLQAEAFKRLQ